MVVIEGRKRWEGERGGDRFGLGEGERRRAIRVRRKRSCCI